MAANLTGKVALITGGAQGLGRAFAECLLARGARVSLVDLNQQVGQKAESELRQRHGSDSTLFVPCDITKKSELKGAFQTTIRAFGGLDIVVNNAGIADDVNWERTIAVNLNALIHGCMLAMEAMRTDKDGHGGLIINVASTAGLTIIPLEMVYTASKFGVVGYSRSLAATFPVDRVGVRVACLCPSFANTEILEKINRIQYKSAVLQEAAKKAERTQKMLGVMDVSEVANAFMRLVDDERAHGAVLTVTPHGQEYRHPRHLKGKL